MNYEYKPRSYAAFQALLVGYEIEEIDALVAHVEEYRDARESRLAALAEKAKIDDDRFVDDFHELMRVGELAWELAIVALHRVVEIHRGWVARRVEPKTNARTLAHLGAVKDLIRRRRQIDIEKLEGATEIDELRCLNNAVKHQAEVTEELAAFPAWKDKAGNKLGDVRPAYNRLRESVPKYLYDLAMKVVADG